MAAVRWQMVNMRLRCILPAVMQQRVFITIRHMKNHQITAVDMHRENLDGGNAGALPQL